MSILDLFRLEGQVAVVTGGSKGIGRGIALALAEAGADVVVAARSRLEVEAVADEIRALGRRAAAFTADVACREQVEALAQAAVDRLGSLTIWVNNAGGLADSPPRLLKDTVEDRWDALIDINLKTVWTGSVAAARHMREGVILNITSIGARLPRPMFGPLTAAKAAANHLTETLALELAPKVRVNAIGPGAIMTDQMLAVLPGFLNAGTGACDDKALEALKDHLKGPLGIPGAPQDIGAAAVYLASPAAKWITGTCLYVAGGLSTAT
ncbi:MAG: SDR family NAD(P)-dependent oxidoreductase [Terriglobales bacterium]